MQQGSRLLLILVMVACCSLIAPGGAAREDTRPTGVFFEPLEVPLINLDIYVFDRDGKPVQGLIAEDFEVLEDGEPVEVTHFFASQSVAPLPAPGQIAAEQAGPGSEARPAIVDKSQGLFLVVYVDEQNFTRSRRNAALQNLQTFFSQDLPASLRVMLISFDGTISVQQPLTENPQELLDALLAMKEHISTTFDLQRGSIIRQIQSTGAPAGSAGGGGGGVPLSDPGFAEGQIDQLLNEIQTYAEERRQRTQACLAALQSTIRSLSGLPGRKAVFYVGDGIEMRPGEDLLILWQRAFSEQARQRGINPLLNSRRSSVKQEVRKVVEAANTYRVSLYTLSSLADAVNAGVSAELRGIGGSSGLEMLPMTSEEAFQEMTSGTGGRSLANNNKLALHLGEVAEELGAYYSLGYRPTEEEVGSYHRIKVRVKRDGVQVRHREGYRIKDINQRMADRTLSAAIHGISENPLGIHIEASEGKPQADGSFMVPILIKVPLGQLVLMPQQASHKGQISVFVAVRDMKGGLSDVQQRQYPVEIPNDKLLEAISQEAGFAMGLAMRNGEQVVAVGVRDELANVEATVTLDINVGKPSA